MPYYMTQASYTADAWKAQIETAQNRVETIRALLEAAGGRLVSWYYSFGEYDIVLISELPDNVSIASVLIAAGGGGAVTKIHTTVLMTADEGQEAIRGAKDVAYTPPS